MVEDNASAAGRIDAPLITTQAPRAKGCRGHAPWARDTISMHCFVLPRLAVSVGVGFGAKRFRAVSFVIMYSDCAGRSMPYFCSNSHTNKDLQCSQWRASQPKPCRRPSGMPASASLPPQKRSGAALAGPAFGAVTTCDRSTAPAASAAQHNTCKEWRCLLVMLEQSRASLVHGVAWGCCPAACCDVLPACMVRAAR